MDEDDGYIGGRGHVLRDGAQQPFRQKRLVVGPHDERRIRCSRQPFHHRHDPFPDILVRISLHHVDLDGNIDEMVSKTATETEVETGLLGCGGGEGEDVLLEVAPGRVDEFTLHFPVVGGAGEETAGGAGCGGEEGWHHLDKVDGIGFRASGEVGERVFETFGGKMCVQGIHRDDKVAWFEKRGVREGGKTRGNARQSVGEILRHSAGVGNTYDLIPVMTYVSAKSVRVCGGSEALCMRQGAAEALSLPSGATLFEAVFGSIQAKRAQFVWHMFPHIFSRWKDGVYDTPHRHAARAGIIFYSPRGLLLTPTHRLTWSYPGKMPPEQSL